MRLIFIYVEKHGHEMERTSDRFFQSLTELLTSFKGKAISNAFGENWIRLAKGGVKKMKINKK